ncbi:MAG: hypothetical protein KDD37_03530 [Bdellovibrionales bacterium]|nr:hypothetical protein [Bdellovibrionales bacterium]
MYFIGSLFIFLATLSSFAADTASSTARIDSELSRLEVERLNLENTIKKENELFPRVGAAVAQGWSAFRGGVVRTFGGDDSKLEEEFNGAREWNSKREQRVDQAQAQLDKVKMQIESTKQDRTNIANFERKLRATQVQADFAALETEIKDFDRKLDLVESQYDKSLMGAYIQDKIGQLLNSQAICAARKRCATNDPQKIDPEVIRQELFPESAKTRSDYYEKVKSRRSTGAN